MFIAFSTLVILILYLGYRFRYHKKWHITFMISAFFIDVTLVLLIETQRQVVEKLVVHPLTPLVYFHAGISSAVLLLYIFMIFLGIRFLKKPDKKRLQLHRRTGMIFFSFRLINYITSFFVVS